MTDLNTRNFGLLIAYVLPGLAVLIGVASYSETVRSWLGTASSDAPTVGGFLYITLASVAAGLIASTIRWLILDWVHHHTGIRPPAWDFSRLQENVVAFDVLVDIHYRYYQFYGNSLVAVVFMYGARVLRLASWTDRLWSGLVFLAVAAILFLGSRDTLAKYYIRSEQLLKTTGDGNQNSRSPRGARSMDRSSQATVTTDRESSSPSDDIEPLPPLSGRRRPVASPRRERP